MNDEFAAIRPSVSRLVEQSEIIAELRIELAESRRREADLARAHNGLHSVLDWAKQNVSDLEQERERLNERLLQEMELARSWMKKYDARQDAIRIAEQRVKTLENALRCMPCHLIHTPEQIHLCGRCSALAVGE